MKHETRTKLTIAHMSYGRQQQRGGLDSMPYGRGLNPTSDGSKRVLQLRSGLTHPHMAMNADLSQDRDQIQHPPFMKHFQTIYTAFR